MSDKDYYSFILKPTEKEIRNEGLIDKLWNIKILNIPNNPCYKKYGEDSNLNTGLKTWKNQLLALKYYYATAQKYFKYYKKSDDEFTKNAYDYWCRKNIEIVIILLSSQYDKSLIIINSLFDIRAERKIGFKSKILNELKALAVSDKNASIFFTKFKDIDDNFGTIINNIRNNVVHNYSDLYPSFEIKIDDSGKELWVRNDVITLEEGFNKIEECVNWLEKLMNAINAEVVSKYPYKN